MTIPPLPTATCTISTFFKVIYSRLNLETPYYELGWGGMMLEDTFAMTANGVRMLDHTTRDIILL